MRINFWVTSKHITCLVVVENHIIVDGAPIVKKRIGQSFEKLLVDWKVDAFSKLEDD